MMAQNNAGQWPGPQGTGHWVQEVELPRELRGPFLKEFVPQGSYRHRGAQIASVVFYRNGGHSVLTVRGAQDHRKPLIGRPSSICHIARGRHQVSFGMALPTRGDQADFACAVDVNWEVADFHLVAEKRVVDVEKMLRPPLLARLRVLTRRHGLDGAQSADEAIQAELAGGSWASFGSEIGLSTEVFVRIDLGRATADFHQSMVRVQYDAGVQSARDQAAAARVQANLPAAKALIEAGEAAQYAHLLAQDPGRAHDILGALQVQAKEQREGALEYLTRLIDQGVVQRHQVEGQVQMLIDYARAMGGKVFEGGLPQPPTALVAPPAEPAVTQHPQPPPTQHDRTAAAPSWARTAPGTPPMPPRLPVYPVQDTPPVHPVHDTPPPVHPVEDTPPGGTQGGGTQGGNGKVDYVRRRGPRGAGPADRPEETADGRNA